MLVISAKNNPNYENKYQEFAFLRRSIWIKSHIIRWSNKLLFFYCKKVYFATLKQVPNDSDYFFSDLAKFKKVVDTSHGVVPTPMVAMRPHALPNSNFSMFYKDQCSNMAPLSTGSHLSYFPETPNFALTGSGTGHHMMGSSYCNPVSMSFEPWSSCNFVGNSPIISPAK